MAFIAAKKGEVTEGGGVGGRGGAMEANTGCARSHTDTGGVAQAWRCREEGGEDGGRSSWRWGQRRWSQMEGTS